MDGQFVDPKECPKSHVVNGMPVCGLCGSPKLDNGYGLGSGYGFGSYTFCEACAAFLDFLPD